MSGTIPCQAQFFQGSSVFVGSLPLVPHLGGFGGRPCLPLPPFYMFLFCLSCGGAAHLGLRSFLEENDAIYSFKLFCPWKEVSQGLPMSPS